jgi:hypothetical protein
MRFDRTFLYGRNYQKVWDIRAARICRKSRKISEFIISVMRRVLPKRQEGVVCRVLLRGRRKRGVPVTWVGQGLGKWPRGGEVMVDADGGRWMGGGGRQRRRRRRRPVALIRGVEAVGREFSFEGRENEFGRARQLRRKGRRMGSDDGAYIGRGNPALGRRRTRGRCRAIVSGDYG